MQLQGNQNKWTNGAETKSIIFQPISDDGLKDDGTF